MPLSTRQQFAFKSLGPFAATVAELLRPLRQPGLPTRKLLRVAGRLIYGTTLLLTFLCAAPQPSDFDGTWLFRVSGQNIFKLTLHTKGGGLAGSLTKPQKLTIDQEGDVTAIGPGQVTFPVQNAVLESGKASLTIDGDRFVMTLQGNGGASLALEGFRPWTLERAPVGASVVLATSLPQPDYPEPIRALRKQLRDMVKDDQDARMAFDEARMQLVDAKNRREVLQIFSRYGWVTHSLAGKDAAHNFWLLVQHQTPEIQRRLLPALAKAAQAGDASRSDYVYLYDRVQLGLGKPQHWGTQTKCENGRPVLAPVDDPAGLEARRKELFFPPVEQYLKMDYLVKLCASGK